MSSSSGTLKIALVLIGNELLSGKIVDENGPYVARRLREVGADLLRIVVIPDDMDTIVEELKRSQTAYDVVITSGGVGPTHDDITLAAVAKACGRKTVLDPVLEGFIRSVFKEKTTADHLRMGTIPEGSDLIDAGPSTWPIVSIDGMYILPGVPQIFRKKFEAIIERFRVGVWYLRNVYLNAEEGIIAQLLAELEDRFEVYVGSYPIWRGADHRVRVTVESRRPAPVNQAVETLLAELASEQVVRVDAPVTDADAPPTSAN